MKNNRFAVIAGAVALAQACVVQPTPPAKAPFSQGAPVVVPAGTPGSQGGTPAPAAPTATATAPKASITGSPVVADGDVFTLSAAGSDAGGGALTYSWTLGAGFAFYPDEASQKGLVAPQIRATSPQMTTSISVSVTNSAGSNSASLAMKIIAGTKLAAIGGGANGATAGAGGDISITGKRIVSNLGETSFALPTAPARVLVIDAKYYANNPPHSDQDLDTQDVYEALNKIEPTILAPSGPTDYQATPPQYDAVELRLTGSLSSINVDLSVFSNTVTGLNIREFRVTGNVTTTGSINITAPDVVINGELRTGAGGSITLSAPYSAARGTGSVFVAKLLKTLGDDVYISAGRQIFIGGDIETFATSGAAGEVTIEGVNPVLDRILLLGSITTSGTGSGESAADITIGSTHTHLVQMPLLRLIDVTGGVASNAAGAGGLGGTVVITADGQYDGGEPVDAAPALVDLSNVRIKADGGEEAPIAGGGDGGNGNTRADGAIEVYAVSDDGMDAQVIVGKLGETAPFITANGGNGDATPGTAGKVFIHADSDSRASVVGLGGATTSNGGSNVTPGMTAAARAAGAGKEVHVLATGAGANSVNWTGNFVSVGGDSIPYLGASGTVGVPGVQGLVTVKTANGRSGQISITGDVVVRRGLGAYDGVLPSAADACGAANVLFVDIDAATAASAAGAAAARISGTVDTRGGVSAAGNAFVASPNHPTPASNDFTASSAGRVSIQASGSATSSSVNVNNVVATGGEGDGGGEGCDVTLQASSAGSESIVYNSIDTSGGRGNKVLEAGNGHKISLFGRNGSSTAFQVAGGNLTSNGGSHSGVGTVSPSANADGGDAGAIIIANANSNAKAADIIDVNVANLSAAGGPVAGRADAIRSGGSGNTVHVLLGAGTTKSTQLVTGTINTNGASGPATGGTMAAVGIGGGDGAGVTLTFNGNATPTLVDVRTGTIDSSGASATMPSNGDLASFPAAGKGGAVTINAKAPGVYNFGAINLNSGNGSSNFGGSNFKFATDAGEAVTATFATISANGGGGNNAGTGAGGDLEFTIPTPITINTQTLSANAGTPGTGGTLGLGGYIHHEGPTSPGYIAITCTGTPGLVTTTTGLVNGSKPCIDAVFSCSAGLGARICGSDIFSQ